MAEAFARRYGSDVLEPKSAGIAPCEMVAPVTREVMLEKNIDLNGSEPKGLDRTVGKFDLIVNMSGRPLPNPRAPVREWAVEDPIWVSIERHREIRDEIEMRVQKLILELRRETGSAGL
jgi:protein-tyrosine-phosphatase